MIRKCLKIVQLQFANFDGKKDYYKILNLTNKATKE